MLVNFPALNTPRWLAPSRCMEGHHYSLTIHMIMLMREGEQSVFSLVVASSLHAASELSLGFVRVLLRSVKMSNHVFSIQLIHEFNLIRA